MRKRQQGQVLLIILVVMAVGLTIGLSTVSRSITDIKISQQEEESARAFSVAEAGIEQALVGAGFSGTIGGVEYQVSELEQGGGSQFDFGGGKFEEQDVQTVWLVEHTAEGLGGDHFPASGTIEVCWGEETTQKSAVEVSVVYQDASGEFQVARGAYDADSGRGNGFDPADDIDGGNCGHLAFAETIELGPDLGIPSDATLYLLRLKLLYNDQPQPLAVSGSESFPTQGKCYVAVANIPESGISRRVKQCQFYKAPPGVFDYVLFSGGDLIK